MLVSRAQLTEIIRSCDVMSCPFGIQPLSAVSRILQCVPDDGDDTIRSLMRNSGGKKFLK